MITQNGKYDTENLQLREATKNVATTNIDSGRDFGMLDRLINKMYVRNKTSEWRGKLSKDKLDKALDFAKNAKSKKKALYFKNKKNENIYIYILSWSALDQGLSGKN